MHRGAAVNLLDVAIVLFAGLAAWSGFRRGASMQLVEYAGLLLGLLAGAFVAPSIARLGSSTAARSTLALAVFLALAAIGEGLGWLLGRRLSAAARRSPLRPLDAAAGSVVSLVAALLAVWFVAYALSSAPVPLLGRSINSSSIVRHLDHSLPKPQSLFAGARQLLYRFGFPRILADLSPSPAAGGLGSNPRQARAIAAKVAASTVRIESHACGLLEEGSGFVVLPHYIVTNAHVVAGASSSVVRQPRSGLTEPASVVLFDPKLDVAVLRVDRTPGLPLRLETAGEGPGTAGAVVGYAGGGPLRSAPATILREIRVEVRDIYGRSIVTRDVYELKAVVRPGDSGGPLAMKDGSVAGVVFERSTAQRNVGYALASGAVLAKVHQADGRTEAVSTGSCTR